MPRNQEDRMTQPLRSVAHGPVTELVIDNPPVNALGHPLRKALADAITMAGADPKTQIIILRAAGRTFPAGADISEFGKPPLDPHLPDLCNLIEASHKPVIAALHGTALGGGLELALGAHWRIAHATTRLGLPEVNLGLLPGAGGTQRVPRLIGADMALEMMLSGKPVAAAQALAMGLIDEVTEGDLADAALQLAHRLIETNARPRPVRDRRDGLRDPVAYAGSIAAARRRLASARLPNLKRIVDCVEAALLLPFDQGLAFERAAFLDLLESPQSAGLRHAFFAERRAAKMPEAKAESRDLRHVAVVGGGLMGSGIAYAALSAGYQVSLMDRDRDGLARGLERIAKLQEGALARGLLTAEKRELDWGRLAGVQDMAALAEADLVIEAVFEDYAVKADVLRALDVVMKPGAVIATNTSYLDVDALAAETSRPDAVVGLHFFSPAHVMKLLEIVVGRETAPGSVAAGLALARRLGKIAVRSGVCDGFIGNRILTAYRTVAEYAVEDGASPAQVDRAMKGFGFALGPFEVSDMAGLQISWARRKRLAATRDPALRYVALADRLCEAGRFGQSTGKGWYAYDGRKPVEDPEVTALIEAERAAKGIVARRFDDDEIALRCLAAMANEGAKILAEGIALRPSDVDVVLLHGYGFPRWEGGPMHWADRHGLLQLAKAIDRFAPEAPEFWIKAPQLDAMIRNGARFAALNRD